MCGFIFLRIVKTKSEYNYYKSFSRGRETIIVLNLLFGIALFLFGMNLMSEHLKKIAGSKTELLLYRLTDKSLKSIAVGAGVTAFIQSSSAVSAMVVGLVENRLITLKRGIEIILGSIFGTAFTGWIVAYSSLQFSSPIADLFSARIISAVFAIVGIVFKVFLKNVRIKRTGEILLGFSILMLGISTISAAVEPMKENTMVLNAILQLKNPLLLAVIGVILAALLQSASAAVGILQTLSVTGIIGLPTAFSLILGIGIGASLPVLVSAIGRNNEAKRAAFSYLCINACGALFCGIIALITTRLIPQGAFAGEMTPISIALINTMYRFAIMIGLYRFIPVIEKICVYTIKNKKGKNFENKGAVQS